MGLFRPYQLVVSFFIWFGYTVAELHNWSGLTAIALVCAYLGIISVFASQMAPRFVLHWLHYLQLLPIKINGLMKPKAITYQPW